MSRYVHETHVSMQCSDVHGINGVYNHRYSSITIGGAGKFEF